MHNLLLKLLSFINSEMELFINKHFNVVLVLRMYDHSINKSSIWFQIKFKHNSFLKQLHV